MMKEIFSPSLRCLTANFTRYQDIWLIRKQKLGLSTISEMLTNSEMNYESGWSQQEVPPEIDVFNDEAPNDV